MPVPFLARYSSPRLALTFLSLILLAWIAHAGILGHGFVYDDHYVLLGNSFIAHPGNLLRLFSSWYINGHRPFLVATLIAERYFWGENPVGYHWTSLCLHLLVALAVWVFWYQVTRNALASWISAALFAVHPVLVEAISCIGFRADLLAAWWFLLAAIAMLRWMARGGWGWLAVAGGTAFIAALSKESALSWPLLMFLALFSSRPGDRFRRRGAVVFLILWTVGMAVFFWWWWPSGYYRKKIIAAVSSEGRTISAGDTIPPGKPNPLAGTSAAPPSPAFPPAGLPAPGPAALPAPFPAPPPAVPPAPGRSVRAAQVVRVTGYGLWQLLFPLDAGTHALDGYALTWSGSSRWLLALLLLFALLAVRARGCSRFGFAALFWGVTMLPVANLLTLLHPLSDRYLYLPAVGIAGAGGMICHRLFQERKTVAMAALALVLILFSLQSGWRTRRWRDDFSFWQAQLRAQPHSAMAHTGVGYVLACRKRYSEAMACYRRAMELDPRLVAPVNYLIDLYLDIGQPARASALVPEALRRNPTNQKSLEKLGYFLLQRKEYAAAEELLQALVGLALRSGNTGNALRASYFLGRCREERGNRTGALEAYRSAGELHPGFAWYHLEYARAQVRLAPPEEAIPILERLGERFSWHPGFRIVLGNARLQKGEVEGARREFERAREGASDRMQEAEAWYGLAGCGERQGRREESRRALEEARALLDRLLQEDAGHGKARRLLRQIEGKGEIVPGGTPGDSP